MNADDKRKLENKLMTMGLPGLNDPDLFQQMADLVSAWPGDKHEYMRDLLNQCSGSERYEAYCALAPRLKFKALSFSQYDAMIAMKAGAMVSQRIMRVEGSPDKPIEIGGHKLQLTTVDDATGAIAKLRCHSCNRTQQFLADTPIGAMIAARQAGWKRDPGLNKEICKECQCQQPSKQN